MYIFGECVSSLKHIKISGTLKEKHFAFGYRIYKPVSQKILVLKVHLYLACE